MNQILFYVIGANGFSSIDNTQTGECWLVISCFSRAHGWIQAMRVSLNNSFVEVGEVRASWQLNVITQAKTDGGNMADTF